MTNNKKIYEGEIVNFDNQFYGQIVVNEKGLIEEVVSGMKYEADKIFGKDSLIFPGMGDIHIHAREDESLAQDKKEDYTTAGNAALNGGLVHISAMPNTNIPLTEQKHFDWHRNRINEISHPVNILNYVGIGNGTRPIGKKGEFFYKAYFGKSVGDLTFYDEIELENTIKYYQKENVSFHVEYEPIIEKSVDGENHSKRRPVEAVNEGLKLLLPIIEKYELNAKLCHWSTGGESFDMIKKHRIYSKENNLNYTTIEVSPLHLLFDTSMSEEDKSLWLKIQMNPAIQSKEHRLDLIKGLKEGFIDYLATDHAPHTEEEKHTSFSKYKNEFPNLSNIEIAQKMKIENKELFEKTCCENGMSGAPWLDVYSNVCIWLMKEHNFKPQDIARITSYNPGLFVNKFLKTQFKNEEFGKGYGKIEKDYVGSFTVLNTNDNQTIKKENLQTKTKWSPLEGFNFSGRLESIIIKGVDMTNKFIK